MSALKIYNIIHSYINGKLFVYTPINIMYFYVYTKKREKYRIYCDVKFNKLQVVNVCLVYS